MSLLVLLAIAVIFAGGFSFLMMIVLSIIWESFEKPEEKAENKSFRFDRSKYLVKTDTSKDFQITNYGIRNYEKGQEGEEKVWIKLKSIPVIRSFHNLILPDEGGNIDHVVLSSKGLYVIETKNYSSRIGTDFQGWYYLYREKIGNQYLPKKHRIASPVDQAMFNSIRLRNHLRSNLKIDQHIVRKINVKAMVVLIQPFSKEWVRAHIPVFSPYEVEAFFSDCIELNGSIANARLIEYLEGLER